MATKTNKNSDPKVQKRVNQASELTKIQIKNGLALAKTLKVPDEKVLEFALAAATLQAANYASFLAGESD